MLTPQEKIDEIYTILKKQEKKEKRKTLFSWAHRIIVWFFLIVVVLFPGFFIEKFFQIAEPLIKDMMMQVFETQKSNLSNLKDSVINSVKNFNINQ